MRTQFVRGEQRVTIGSMEVLPLPCRTMPRSRCSTSSGRRRLGVLTDIGIGTRHVERCLRPERAGARVQLRPRHALERRLPALLKERIGGPLGTSTTARPRDLLAALDRSKLKHLIGAHLSQQNNKPDLARDTLAPTLNCSPDWIGLATQDDGFDWREALIRGRSPIYSGRSPNSSTALHRIRLATMPRQARLVLPEVACMSVQRGTTAILLLGTTRIASFISPSCTSCSGRRLARCTRMS